MALETFGDVVVKYVQLVRNRLHTQTHLMDMILYAKIVI